MKVYKNSVIVPDTIESVFDFFNRPENLVKLMPSFMSFQLLTPGQLIMKEGAIFDYKVSVFGIPNRWTTYISDYNPPYSFADIQLKGPHSYWHHVHEFEQSHNGTRVSDTIHYVMPLGILGQLADVCVMAPIVSRLFNHRKRVIEQTFGSIELDYGN